MRWFTLAVTTGSSGAGTSRPSNVCNAFQSISLICKPFHLVFTRLFCLMFITQVYSARMCSILSCASISTSVATALPLATGPAASVAGKLELMPVARSKIWCWRPSTLPERRTLRSSSSVPTATFWQWDITRTSLTCTRLCSCLCFVYVCVVSMLFSA